MAKIVLVLTQSASLSELLRDQVHDTSSKDPVCNSCRKIIVQGTSDNGHTTTYNPCLGLMTSVFLALSHLTSAEADAYNCQQCFLEHLHLATARAIFPNDLYLSAHKQGPSSPKCPSHLWIHASFPPRPLQAQSRPAWQCSPGSPQAYEIRGKIAITLMGFTTCLTQAAFICQHLLLCTKKFSPSKCLKITGLTRPTELTS